MAVLHNLKCRVCERTYVDEWVEHGDYGRCDCGGHRSISFVSVHTDMDHMIYAPSVETERMVTVREARRLAREKGLSVESKWMDKHHGARQEREETGRLYSGGGLTRRSGYDSKYGSGR